VAPGLSHILVAATEKELGGLTDLVIYVGGFPQNPTQDAFRHAVYFNPLDLMSEYLRPARVRLEGKLTALTPLDPEHELRMRDDDVGRLDAFPSDGLRSLLTSYPKCTSMMEYTLRWPGHLDEMRRLADAGKLAPASVAQTANGLAKSYPASKFPDYLLMEVNAVNQGRDVNWRLLDRASDSMSAMSRTTAFTAASAAHVLARGEFKKAGAHPPEALGKKPGVGAAMIADLRKRGVVVERARKLHVFLGRRSLEY
jgi:saccharopine dehydrogenase-like NADP-dependent oxidoreductase